MQKYFLVFFLLCVGGVFAQKKEVSSIQPSEAYDNIHVQKLDSDESSTAFVIWVKNGVKLHKHEHHTETLYVVSGEGTMTLGKEKFEIGAGDYVRIPENTTHSVKVTSKEPLKVISLQAPEFLGKDRVFVE